MKTLVRHVEVLRPILMIQKDRNRGAAQDAECVSHNREEEEHGNAGEDARRNELAHRINTQSTHGVDLLGDDHGAQLAGHRRRVAACNHDAGEHGAQFTDHGEADKLTGDRRSAKLCESGCRLQGKHAACKEA